jgi:dTMP kinase
LKAGEIVLSDRYADSTIAYQGYGHQQDIEQVRALITYATGGLVPDLTVLLDLDVEVGLGRKRKADEWNRLDAYTVEFHQRVRAGYLEMVKLETGRWIVIDAGQAWNEVQEELRKVVMSALRLPKDEIGVGGV